MFCPIDDGGDWQEIVLGGQIDGGVVFQTLPADVAEAVRERNLPLVLLGDNSDPTLSQVVVDDFAGAFAATKYLIGLGPPRVMLFVHESVKPHCSVHERLGGYRAAMDEAGLTTRELSACPKETRSTRWSAATTGRRRPFAIAISNRRCSSMACGRSA